MNTREELEQVLSGPFEDIGKPSGEPVIDRRHKMVIDAVMDYDKILEIGPGNGKVALYLMNQGKEVDILDNTIEKLGDFLNIVETRHVRDPGQGLGAVSAQEDKKDNTPRPSGTPLDRGESSEKGDAGDEGGKGWRRPGMWIFKTLGQWKGIEDDCYDCVFASEVIEHIEDYKLAVNEMIRIAKKKVVITTPIGKSFSSPDHKHIFSIKDFRFIKERMITDSIITKLADRETGQRCFYMEIFVGKHPGNRRKGR